MLFYFLFILPVVADFEAMLANSKCNIPILDEIPTRRNIPFILRHPKFSNKKFKEAVRFEHLHEKYGDRKAGIDYPGSEAAPTNAWRSIKFGEYLERYVFHGLSLDEYVERDDYAILWGPSDSCIYTGGCRDCGMPSCMSHHSFIPAEVQDLFQCHTNQTHLVSMGIGGKYGGLNFHNHEAIFNQLVYGKKLWYIVKPDTRLNLRKNRTSIETLREYMNHPEIMMCIQEEGDFIYIPDQFYHLTFNLEKVFMAACSEYGLDTSLAMPQQNYY